MTKKPVDEIRPLTEQEKLFASEYTIDFNGTRAAIEAKYSARSATVQASRLLSRANIQQAVKKYCEERVAKAGLTTDKVLKELMKLAFSNMNDYTDWGESGVTLKSSDELTPEQAACVMEVSETITQHGGTIRFKLHDKTKSLELLGKYLAMFTDKTALVDGDGKPLQTGVVLLPLVKEKEDG